MRFFLLVSFVICFYTNSVFGRNETLHACELVLKCFQDADSELLQCQNFLTEDSLPQLSSVSNEITQNNETTLATTASPSRSGSEDCMEDVKRKMHQKRLLIQQRADAFAFCLNQRMDRGPEDVDARKFRYCNTVISRYIARTTQTASPELTSATPSLESTSTSRPSTRSSSQTTRSKSSQSITDRGLSKSTTISSTSHGSTSSKSVSSSTIRSTISSTRARPRRQAPSVNLELENPNEALTPSNATENRQSPASTSGKRLESTTISTDSLSTSKPDEKTNDPFQIEDQTGSTNEQKSTSSDQPQTSENEAGRIGAVARFFSNGSSLSANKEEPKNETIPQLESSETNSEETNQTRASGSQEKSTIGSTVKFPNGASPPANGPPGFTEEIQGDNFSTKSPDPTQISLNLQQSTPIPDIGLNASISNDTSTNGIIVQLQEQDENGVVQKAPLDQSIGDQDSGASPPGISPFTSTSSSSISQSATPSSTGGPSADEKQRTRVETLRESRRRVSEFKACMARARIKREECKPLVNCCPDTAKCHLRYELSELHDQIHRLELEISEGRQACLLKKKVDDQFVDAMDQIDEEDFISDESIVSQQVF